MMKKKMSKFTRILIASLVSVIALGTACWGVTKLVASDTYEPIVWRFNNWNDYSKLNAYKTTAEFYDGEDGKKAFSLQAQDEYNSYFYIPSTELSGIDFSQYKYIVYSAKCVGKTKEGSVIYISSESATNKSLRFTLPSDEGWTTTLVDVAGKTSTTYDSEGTQIFNGGLWETEAVDYWSGTLTQFRVDYCRYNKDGTTYLEYIGLFHTKEEAQKYAGVMPNDEAAEAITTTLENGFTLPFSQAATQDLAKEYAAKKVTECVEAYFTENGEITHDIQVKGISDYKIDGTGGSFKARVWIYLGEALKRNLIDETITFKVNAKPAPVAVHYNSQAVVDAMSWYVGSDDTLTKTFISDNSVQEGGYVKLTASSTSWCDPNYNNYLNQAGVRNTFTFDDYPYMKILYNREVYDTGERTFVYITDTNNKTSSFDFNLYKLSTGQESYWQALVADMRTDVVNFYDISGKYTASGSITLGNNAEWAGKPHATSANPLRFDLTRQNKAERTMSVAYIAFFATEEEAIAYPNSIQGAFDAAMLKNNASFEVGNYVTTNELAHAEAKAYVDSFNFTTDYEISNGSLTKPSTTSEGTYTFDVTFSDSNGSYKVSCAMTIAKTETPIVYTLDNNSIVSKFQATTNLKKTLEKGYLKMISPDPAAEDGFYLETATSTLGEEFDLTGRRFAKVRYRLSGVEGKASSTKMQFYTVVDGKYYNKTSLVLSEKDIGDIVELIVDFSASGTAEAVWLKNVTDGGDYQVKTLSNQNDTTPLGTVTKIRFNPARIANADRTSYVEYIGFFSSLEEAKSYNGIADERLNEAEQSIREKLVELEWGEGNTEEKALAKFDAMIQSDIGCTLKDIVYKAPTDKEEGNITFTAVLYSGGVEREVKDLRVVIGKAPDPVIWRFNEESALDDIVFQMNTEASIENNVLKLVNTYSGDAEGFGFTLNTDSETQFYLQNNPYIVVKYRRDGVGPVTIKYTTDLNKNTTFYANNGNLGFGPESGTWYTTVVDTGVKNYESPLVRNYSHDENVDDFNFYIPYKVPLSNSDIYKFQGLSQSFTFSLANFRDVERTCYIEYLGFFPTLDAALNYDEEYESVTSDTEVALKDYTGETVSYYDGDSEETAKKTAKRLIDERLLDDAHTIKKLNDVDIAIETGNYVPPVKEESDGTYNFSASITYNDQVIYTIDSCTLTISQRAEEQVYLFTNPDFVATIEGAEASDNYDCMQLNDGVNEFTLDVSDRNISLANYPRISLGLTEAKGTVTMTVNDTTLTLCEDESIMNAELSVVLTSEGYKVYKDADEQPIQSGTISEDILNAPLEHISFGFGEEGAKVRYLVFFAEESVSEVFDYTVPDELKNIADITDSTCHAGDASTRAKAVERAKKLALKSAGDGVSAVKTTLNAYQASTTSENGTYTCTVLLAYGKTKATYYKEVNVAGKMSVQPSEPIWLKMDENSVSNIYKKNLTMSLVNGCIHTETESANTEDAFFEFSKSCLSESTLYLPDYPYISIQFKRTGVINGDTGDTQIYFWTDENPDPSKNHPSLECSFGAEDLLNEWVTAIIDTNTMMVTLYDMNDEKVYSTATFDGSMGQYIGNLNRMRLTMARNIKTDRTADIKYFGFFSTLEAAEEYMDGMYINHYMQFAGNECAILNKAINTEAMTVELAARIDSTMKGTKMPLISNKGAETESCFALEINEEGHVQLTCDSNVIATTEEDICTGKWTYVTASVDKDSAKIYLNGELKAEGQTGINTDAIKSDELVVGGDYVDESKKLVGDLANIKFYSALKEPTGYEMPETMTDDMIAGWALDAITTERNFVGYETSDYILTLHDQLSRQGHEFVGSDCLITENEIASAPQTVEGWMKVPRTQLNGTYTLIATSGMRVQLVDGQIVAFYNDSEVLRTAELQIIPGMWTHIAVTFDGTYSKVKLYVNGDLNTTTQVTIELDNVSLGKVYIGATEEKTAMFKGMLSDVTLWSTVRDTIASDMKEAISTTDEGLLLGAWDLCTHDILDYVDASLQNNTATLTSDTWYKLEGRETPAYTIVQVSDTQNTTGFSGEVKHQAMFDWIAANVNNMNMVYLTHGGDVTQINTESQWQEARKAFNKIEDLLPYGIALGNHDYATPSHGIGAELRDDRLFNKYFPYADYAENPWFGGAFEEGSRSNIYNLIEVDVDKDGDADEEYIFFSLEFGPRDEVVDWVCKTLEEHAERKAIITTHSYLENDGSYSIKNVTAYGSYDFKDANEGFDLWNKIAYEYPNVIMITCGHTQGNSSAQEVNQNKLGNNVVQILADPSAYGGFPSVESLIFMMTFDKNGNMNTYYYSADRDMYYGTVNEYEYSADDYFEIPTSESK